MTVTEVIPRYLTYCEQQKQLDAKTRKAYRIDLTQMAEVLGSLDVMDVTSEQLEGVFASWHNKYAPKTVKRKIAAIKAFFHWLELRGHQPENPFQKIHTKFREPKVLPKTIPIHVLEQLLEVVYGAYHAADTNQKQQILRDIAVLELLFCTGMRISELCSLRLSDINLVEGEVRIYGKGRKERIIPITDGQILELLYKYAETYRDAIARQEGRFFINQCGRPLQDQSVRQMIEKYKEQAGIHQHITPHMFRHTFATTLLESDVNLRFIQELLGHSSIQTTEIYTHVSAAKQRTILSENSPRKHLHIQAEI